MAIDRQIVQVKSRLQPPRMTAEQILPSDRIPILDYSNRSAASNLVLPKAATVSSLDRVELIPHFATIVAPLLQWHVDLPINIKHGFEEQWRWQHLH
jgi:hypothetical protein